MEEPGYPGASAAFLAAGARVIPVPVDTEGLNIQAGRSRSPNAQLAYVTPSHQFPLGMTMSAARRVALIDWASQAQAWIIEDDYDSEYRYTSRPVAALQGLDPNGRVLYIGTFSKVLFPSLRLGYLVVPPALVEICLAAQAVIAGQPPLIEQAVLTEFITEGHLGRHIRRMRVLYEERQAVLLKEARRSLSGLMDIEPTQTGLQTIGWLRPGIEDRMAAKHAAQHNVEVAPLSTFYRDPPESQQVQQSDRRSGCMLGFAAFTPSMIRAGIKRLRQALSEL